MGSVATPISSFDGSSKKQPEGNSSDCLLELVASYPDLFERWRRPDSDGENPAPTPDPTSRRGRWRRELLETYGSPEENPGFWAAISPNSYLGDLSGPIQLHHGTADSSVPVEFSEILGVVKE